MQKLLLSVLVVALIAGCDRPARERPKARAGKDSPGAGQAADPPGGASSHAPAAAVNDPAKGAAAGGAQDEVPLDEPTGTQPVVVAAAIFPPRAGPGDVVTMAVRFRTADGWHFFAMDDRNPEGPVAPTKLVLDLPAGLSADEDWVRPPVEDHQGPAGPGKVYGNDVTFRRRIRVDARQPRGAVTLPCRVSYQSCDDKICLRPTPQTLRPTLEVVARSAKR